MSFEFGSGALASFTFALPFPTKAPLPLYGQVPPPASYDRDPLALDASAFLPDSYEEYADTVTTAYV
jgi:hypothetical protein